MPTALRHYCGVTGCGVLVNTPYCPTHTKSNQRHYDVRRGSSTERGYGVKWRAYVQRFRGNYPLCGMRPPGAPETADSDCARRCQPTPMYVVDHIVPVTGADDPSFFRATNHQALCETCHNRKRQRESRTG